MRICLGADAEELQAVHAASSTDLGDICDLDLDAAACNNLPRTCGKISAYSCGYIQDFL